MSSPNKDIDIDLSNCRIISDPEGYDINQLLNDKESTNIKNGNILVLGDLLDSTFIGTPSADQFETKSYNIRNLDLVNKNENIFVAMGNRDLNKIKCHQLLALKKEDKYKFLGESSTKDFESIVENLKEICNGNGKSEGKGEGEGEGESDTNPWFVDKLTDENGFSPFWNPKRKTELWKGTNQTTHTCLKRFNIIFGPDGSVGTMSAQNLLETIPMELKELGFITNPEFMKDEETKAACVLAFFKLALMESNDNLNIQFTKKDINIVGILRRFYKRPQNFVCAYKEFSDGENKQISLFSHGGITKTFLNTNGFYKFNLSDSGVTAKLEQSGGYLGTGEKVKLETIKTRI